MNSYKNFKRSLSKYPKLIKCPMCDDATMLTSDFEKHCKNVHDLNPSVSCVFCRKFSWPRSQKLKNGTHLKQCLKKFTIRYKFCPPVAASVVAVVAEPPAAQETICSCATFRSEDLRRLTRFIPEWSETDISEGGVDLMYKSLFPENEDGDWYRLPDYDDLVAAAKIGEHIALLNTIKFHSSTGLDESVKWIQRYLYHEKRFGWYHVCVRAGCMKSFMENLQGLKIVELPYWCVCKGRGAIGNLPSNVATWKHHRHSILMVEDKVRFKRCLEHSVVYATGVVPLNGKRYYCNEIKDVSHFVSTIAYVSTSKPKCNCDNMTLGSSHVFDEMTKLACGQTVPKHSIEGSHYFIEKPVIPHAVVWMLLVVPDMALERYCKFRVGTRSVLNLKSREKYYGQWHVSASEELEIRNCPVIFDPVRMRIGDVIGVGNVIPYVTDCRNTGFVYWFGGKMLKVIKFDEGPDDLEGFREYCFKNKINTMLNFRDSLFPLPVKGQRHANDLCLLENQIKSEWQDKYDKLQDNYDELQEKYNKLQNKYNELQNKYNELQDKYDRLENKYDELQDKYDLRESAWQIERNDLIEKYNAQLNEMRKNIEQLNLKLETQYTERIRELNISLEEERENKRILEEKLKDCKCEIYKYSNEQLKTVNKQLQSCKRKLKKSEEKFETFKTEKYLPLQRDLNNALRREKRLRTKK